MDGRILEFNDLYCAMLGYEREELLALTYVDLTPGRWHAFEAAIVVEQVLPRGHSEVYEKEYRRKDGTVFPVELRTVLLRDDSGAPTAMWATVRDVSGRRRAEEALRESEARFKSLFENSLLGLYRTTPGGDILMANPTLCRMLGFATFEELARRNLEHEGFEPEYPRGEFKRRMVEEGRVVGLESHWATHDGRTLYVRESARAVRGADGEIRFFEGTVEDITERRRAEEALRENEERYRAVVDQASDGITITDRTWRFLDVNPRACEMFGRTREELLEMSVRDIGVPEDLAAHPLHDAELERGRTILTTRSLRRADGSAYTVEISARGLPDGRVVSILRDVTERARMEQALRESETRYRGLVEQASDGIWIMTTDTVLLEVNSRLCELVGWRRDELVGRKVAEFLVPGELERNPLRVEAVLRGETVLNERTIRRRDGTTFPAETSTRALPDGRVIGIVRDITERM
jgi:PAS domain S-box-containing protein